MSQSPSHNPPFHTPPPKRRLPVNMLLVENRIRVFMEHSNRYAFMGEARLAKDCGVSDASICRLLVGYSSPSFAMLCKLTQAFEKEFKKKIDPRELAALDGKYPTLTVCEIVGCNGCSPQAAWNADDTMKPEYSDNPKSESSSQAKGGR